ncbi:MAG TPA: transcription antitermination factor NusB [Gammaproteobacteria bacterium]|nr:transcription antitermination factor NusB [Gammaproteobacteria bacterium]
MNPTARRNARQYALQAMYQWQISSTPVKEIELDFLIHHIKQKTDLDYFKELIHGIPENCDELDNRMTPFLSRPIGELDPIELAILRLGIYELEKRLDVPYRVAINEALELTKKFGSIEGYKFVNGILDQVARAVRVNEIKADKKS